MKNTVKLVKLSELADNIELSIEESHTAYTVAELKREILELGEPHHKLQNWYTIERRKWKPDAESMLFWYIENKSDDMYEDWRERADDCIKREHIEKIQAVLDEMFSSDYATAYWVYVHPVEIDIFPQNREGANT